MTKQGNSFNIKFKEETPILIIKEEKLFEKNKNNLNNKINNKMSSLSSFGFLKSTFNLPFYLIILIIFLIGGNGQIFIYAKEIRTSSFQLNPQKMFGDEFNEIQQFQRTYSNNLEFFKRNNNNYYFTNNNLSPSSILYSSPQKRRLVVRVPFASQNPDGSQLSRIYKQLFEPTNTRTKKQPWSPFYQSFIMETK